MERERRERTFRGITERLARRYLENVGGEAVDEGELVGPDGRWRATLSSETVSIGPTLEVTAVTVAFEGESSALEDVVERFSQKAMRAGG